MSIKCLFITNLVLGKVAKENHKRKVRKSEERKVKNIGKNCFLRQNSQFSYLLLILKRFPQIIWSSFKMENSFYCNFQILNRYYSNELNLYLLQVFG